VNFRVGQALAASGNTWGAFGTVTDAAANLTSHFWGMQAELGTVATSYIPTLGSTVTRATDTIKALLTTMPAPGSEYSMMHEMAPMTLGVIGNPYSYSISDNSIDNTATLGVEQAAGGSAGQVVRTGSSTVVNTNGGAVSLNTYFKAAGRVKLNDFAVSINGAAVVADTSGAIPVSPTVLCLGNYDGIPIVPYRVKTIIAVPRAWTDPELVTRATP
jgi:hypothetical protein